jgi:hypothetical protein
VIRVFSGVPEGFRTPRGKLWALLGHTGKREAGHRGCCAPPLAGPNWTRVWGGATPPFPSPSLSLPSPFQGGTLLGLGVLVGLSPLPWRTPRGPASPPPLYTEEGGASSTQVDYPKPCAAPPPPFRASVIFSESLGEALPESLHHHRRHAVVLTELIYFLDILLDQEGEGRHRAVRV